MPALCGPTLASRRSRVTPRAKHPSLCSHPGARAVAPAENRLRTGTGPFSPGSPTPPGSGRRASCGPSSSWCRSRPATRGRAHICIYTYSRLQCIVPGIASLSCARLALWPPRFGPCWPRGLCVEVVQQFGALGPQALRLALPHLAGGSVRPELLQLAAKRRGFRDLRTPAFDGCFCPTREHRAGFAAAAATAAGVTAAAALTRGSPAPPKLQGPPPSFRAAANGTHPVVRPGLGPHGILHGSVRQGLDGRRVSARESRGRRSLAAACCTRCHARRRRRQRLHGRRRGARHRCAGPEQIVHLRRLGLRRRCKRSFTRAGSNGLGHRTLHAGTCACSARLLGRLDHRLLGEFLQEADVGRQGLDKPDELLDVIGGGLHVLRGGLLAPLPDLLPRILPRYRSFS